MEIKTIFIPEVFTNCYLISDRPDGETVVVDPGGGENTAAFVKTFLDGSGARLSAVLLTHGHYDHVGAVAALREKFPEVPVYLHPLDTGRNQEDIFPTAGLDGVLPLSEGQVIRAGGLTFQVLHTPGHTPGSVCFLCGDGQSSVLLTGDTLFRGSCGRTDFPGGDWKAMIASLRRLAGLDGDYPVLPGHDEPTTLAEERRGNPFVRSALARA